MHFFAKNRVSMFFFFFYMFFFSFDMSVLWIRIRNRRIRNFLPDLELFVPDPARMKKHMS